MSKPCEHCGRRSFEVLKVYVGDFCASCGAEIKGPWSYPFKLPCGHDPLRNACMRTKNIERCTNGFCFKTRPYSGS